MTLPPEAADRLPARAFNLLDTPWVPVRYIDGRAGTLGLLDIFDRAAEIAGLAESSPTTLVALHRLLLAISHRALTMHLGRWTDGDRARWFTQGLPTGALTAYLNRWRERFWLFHPEHPFMQVAALATAQQTHDKFKPWTQVALACSSGNAPVVFDHAVDTEPAAIDADAVLLHLLGFLQFTPGGLVKVFRGSDKAGPLANSAAVLPIGANLLQTLTLALSPYAAIAERDLPCWERAAPTIEQLEADPQPATGPCDRYTRISRAVQLLPEQDGRVLWLRFGAGMGLLEDDNAPDPMVSYRPASVGLLRMSFTEGRAIWRDLGALLPDASGTLARPAAVLNWSANLHAAIGDWDSEAPVLLAGLCSDQAKLVRWRSESYRLPIAAEFSADVSTALRNELRRCEAVFDQLRSLAVELLARSMPDDKAKDTRARAREMLKSGPFAPTFFARAERHVPLLVRQVVIRDLEAAHAGWSAALLEAAQEAWVAVHGTLGTSAAALRADALTHGRYLSAIRPLRPPSLLHVNQAAGEAS